MQLFRKPQQPKHKHITGLGASEISLPCPVPHGNMATLCGVKGSGRKFRGASMSDFTLEAHWTAE